MGSYHVVVLSGLANITETIAWRAAGALSGLRVSLDSLANVALGNGRALHYILAEQGGVCDQLLLYMDKRYQASGS